MVERTYEMMITHAWRKDNAGGAGIREDRHKDPETKKVPGSKAAYAVNSRTGQRIDFPSCTACDRYFGFTGNKTSNSIREGRKFDHEWSVYFA